MEIQKELVFDPSDTNEIICRKISERVKSIPLSELTAEISKDFVFQEQAIRKIYVAAATCKNGLFFGPGGFSKSKLIKHFFKILGIPVVYKIGHVQSTVEDLLGMPNIKKMMDESKIETAFENSVFSTPSVLILEEFMDCPPAVAAALKDVLTERGFREGNTFKESKISSVFIVGNKSPEDIADNDSLKAFYDERFPFQLRMIWDDFSAHSYMKFFKIYFKERINDRLDEFTLLAELCANTKSLVSPRIASDGGDVILNLGVEFIDTLTGIDTTEISKFRHQSQLKACLLKEEITLNKLEEAYKSLLSGEKPFNDTICECELIMQTIKAIEFSPDSVIRSGLLYSNVETLKKELLQDFIGEEYSVLKADYKKLI